MKKILSALKIQNVINYPTYLIVKERLLMAIHAGFWSSNESIDHKDQLAEHLGCSTKDVITALNLLIIENQITKIDEDYFLTPKIDQPIDKLTNLGDMLHQRGFIAETRWLSKGIYTANDEEMGALNLISSSQVYRLERLRLANDIVIGYEKSSIPSEIIKDSDDIGKSLYSYLRSINIKPTSATEFIEAAAIDSHLAQLTGLKLQSPAIHLIRITLDAEQMPFELTHSYFRSDYYRFSINLKI